MSFRYYRVFGGTLRSQMHFPELLETIACESYDWQVSRMEAESDDRHGILLSEEHFADLPSAKLIQRSSGIRLSYPPVGSFDISHDGTSIDWIPGEHDCFSCARQAILGRVMALAIDLAGDFCLHGSCVRLSSGVNLAFVAFKGTGKSTLASALVAAGAQLVTDDMLRIDTRDQPVRHFPGVPRLRLNHDSARFAENAGIELSEPAEGKRVSRSVARVSENNVPERLGGIYVLQRGDASESAGPVRRLLAGTEAVMAVMSQAMLAGLMPAEPRLLRHAARLASAVPVYSLTVPRGFEVLNTVVNRLESWHPSEMPSAVATSAGELV